MQFRHIAPQNNILPLRIFRDAFSSVVARLQLNPKT
jgi:hypothetical protein